MSAVAVDPVARAEEEALVRHIRERTDRNAAFAELFEANRVRVYAIGRNLTRSRADAEVRRRGVRRALARARLVSR